MVDNLYNSLGYNVSDNDLTNDQKDFLIENIQKLNVDKKETIYFLILHDFTLKNKNTKVIFPYKSKQITNDKFEIKLDAIPNKCKQILYKFVNMEITAMEMTNSFLGKS